MSDEKRQRQRTLVLVLVVVVLGLTLLACGLFVKKPGRLQNMWRWLGDFTRWFEERVLAGGD